MKLYSLYSGVGPLASDPSHTGLVKGMHTGPFYTYTRNSIKYQVPKKKKSMCIYVHPNMGAAPCLRPLHVRAQSKTDIASHRMLRPQTFRRHLRSFGSTASASFFFSFFFTKFGFFPFSFSENLVLKTVVFKLWLLSGVFVFFVTVRVFRNSVSFPSSCVGGYWNCMVQRSLASMHSLDPEDPVLLPHSVLPMKLSPVSAPVKMHATI